MPAKKTAKKVARKKAKASSPSTRGRGRPSPYEGINLKHVEFLASKGMTDAEIADFCGVGEKTINNWKAEHPEFLQSLKAGKDEYDNLIERRLAERAMGYSHEDTKFATHEGMITDREVYMKHYPPDTTAAIFWLKNRRPKEWRDKIEVTGEGGGPIKVTIGGDV